MTPSPTPPAPPSAAWRTERAIDAAGVARILREQFPALGGGRPLSVAYLNEGWDSQAFLVTAGAAAGAAEHVFRFPKRADCDPFLETEIALLPALAPRLPLAIPRFDFVGEPSALYPARFVGYRKLPGLTAFELAAEGRTVSVEAVAPALAALLNALHAVPLAEAEALKVRRHAAGRDIGLLRTRARERLPDVRAAAPTTLLERVHALLVDDRALPSPPPPEALVLVHNDIYDEHVLLDPATLRPTGLIDWGDAAIDDRAIDFAGLYSWLGEPLLRALLARYVHPVDPELPVRARFYAACMSVFTLHYGVETGRAGHVASGLRQLGLAV